MNRRGFIGGLLGAGAAMVLDPEKLLWVPGQKMISIPNASVAPPRIPWGIRIPSGIVVYADEVCLTGGIAKDVDFGEFRECKIATMKFDIDLEPFWVQIKGHSLVRLHEDYSPSLAG